jgi:hypothetical protein
MQRKTKLELDALQVDSFPTTAAEAGAGTVHAHSDSDVPQPTPPVYDVPCTCAATCLCKTAYYQCGTGPYTIYSCDYTQNASCLVTQ